MNLSDKAKRLVAIDREIREVEERLGIGDMTNNQVIMSLQRILRLDQEAERLSSDLYDDGFEYYYAGEE